MSQKIRIKLKSYDYNLVDKSAEKIVKTVKTTGAMVTGPIPLPTHKKIFTRAAFKAGVFNFMVVYNSHFDHLGKISREKSVDVIMNHIRVNDYLKNAIIVMGDFNSVPSERPIMLLKENLEDSFKYFNLEKPYGTFNGFDLKSKMGRRIDYIFTKNINVYEYKHIDEKLKNGNWPSDHVAVFTTIKSLWLLGESRK